MLFVLPNPDYAFVWQHGLKTKERKKVLRQSSWGLPKKETMFLGAIIVQSTVKASVYCMGPVTDMIEWMLGPGFKIMEGINFQERVPKPTIMNLLQDHVSFSGHSSLAKRIDDWHGWNRVTMHPIDCNRTFHFNQTSVPFQSIDLWKVIVIESSVYNQRMVRIVMKRFATRTKRSNGQRWLYKFWHCQCRIQIPPFLGKCPAFSTRCWLAWDKPWEPSSNHLVIIESSQHLLTFCNYLSAGLQEKRILNRYFWSLQSHKICKLRQRDLYWGYCVSTHKAASTAGYISKWINTLGFTAGSA